MPTSLPFFDDEALRRVVDDDLDAFFFGVFQFPGRSFEEARGTARHHFDIFAAEAARRAAAIHGGVADADDQHLFADRIEMAERDRAEPVDADVDAVRIVTAGQFEVLAARRAAADEDGVEALVEQAAGSRRASCSGSRRPCRGWRRSRR
jgi:predicted  nucleic acid-binding Zn-ribbon protein